MVPFPLLVQSDVEEYSVRDGRRRKLQNDILGLLSSKEMKLDRLMKDLNRENDEDRVLEALLNLIDTGYIEMTPSFDLRLANVD